MPLMVSVRTGQWKKVVWCDQLHFLLDQVDGWMCVDRLPREEIAAGCWEILGPGIQVTQVTCTTCLNVGMDHVHANSGVFL